MSADTIAESGDQGVLQGSLVFRMALACKKRKNSNYLQVTDLTTYPHICAENRRQGTEALCNGEGSEPGTLSAPVWSYSSEQMWCSGSCVSLDCKQ